MISDFKVSLQVTKFNQYFHYHLVYYPGVNLLKLLQFTSVAIVSGSENNSFNTCKLHPVKIEIKLTPVA